VQEERLVAFDAEGSNEFGRSVALSANDAVVGAYRAHYDGPGPRVNLAGAVYVYVRSDTDWVLQQQIFSDYRTNAAGFGYAVAISGENLIGGCVTWRAHVFERSGSTWTEVRRLVAHDSLVTDDFGNAVALSGTTAMVGAPNNWLDPSGENNMSQAGAVYVFGPGSTDVGRYGGDDIPHRLELSQNFPNPFNPTTTLEFSVAGFSHVTLTTYDMLGRQVSVLVDEKKKPGRHRVTLDGTGLASGTYFYRLTADGQTLSRRFLLLK
jgi:hypothetical protein